MLEPTVAQFLEMNRDERLHLFVDFFDRLFFFLPYLISASPAFNAAVI